jgi:hypothetical protein
MELVVWWRLMGCENGDYPGEKVLISRLMVTRLECDEFMQIVQVLGADFL